MLGTLFVKGSGGVQPWEVKSRRDTAGGEITASGEILIFVLEVGHHRLGSGSERDERHLQCERLKMQCEKKLWSVLTCCGGWEESGWQGVHGGLQQSTYFNLTPCTLPHQLATCGW